MTRHCLSFWSLLLVGLVVLAKKEKGKKNEETTTEAEYGADEDSTNGPTKEGTSTWFPNIDVLLKPEEDIVADLKYWKVVPDFFDEAPKHPMQAWWFEEDLAMGPEAKFGNELSDPEFLNEEPFWLEWKAENDTYYTMIMVGIDEKVKSRGMTKEKQYWIVGNIKEYDFMLGDYLTEYVGPVPRKEMGYQRYVFVVYKQPNGKIEFKEPKITSTQDNRIRANFSTKAFAKKYNLGKPYATNFFRARHIAPS